MKKWMSILLALVLVCGFSLPALADLYEEFGSMWEWTDEQIEASESWTEEQWDEYYTGEDNYYRNQSRLANADAKRLLGCPYPMGANVKINDTFLNFGAENAPYYEEGDVMLPVRALSELLKAELTYDNATKTASLALPDGPTLKFAVGSTLLTVQESGSLKEVELWEVPVIREGKMYMPVEILVEGLGYTESWDYYYEISYLVDKEALIQDINNRFTIYNNILAGTYQVNAEQSQLHKGSVTLSGTLYGEEKHDTISASLAYELVQRGLNYSGSFELKLDLSQMEDSIFTMLDEEDWEIIRKVNGGKGQIIYNDAADTMYIQSSLLSLLDESWKETDWLKIEDSTEYNELALSFYGISGEQTLGDLIYSLSSGYYVDDVYAQAHSTAGIMELIFGDNNFKKTTKGQVTTYTIQTNTASLQNSLDSTQNASLQAILSPSSWLLGVNPETGGAPQVPTFEHKLVLQEEGGQLTHFTMDSNLATKGVVPTRLAVQIAVAPEKTEMRIAFAGRYFGKLEISAQSTTVESDKAPATVPPAEATIVDAADLYYDYDGYYDEYEDLYLEDEEDATEPADTPEAEDALVDEIVLQAISSLLLQAIR